ncbi:MAG: hypothetical protein QXS24_04360 [Desulfurococcaceae archaeon]
MIIRFSVENSFYMLINALLMNKIDVNEGVFKKKKSIILVPLSFINEETMFLILKVSQLVNSMVQAEYRVKVVLNDCDEDTVIYTKILVNLHKLLPGSRVEYLSTIATYLTLLRKYSLILKELKKQELDEHKYYEYQLALEKTTHYLGLLVEKLNNNSILNEALSMLDQLEEKHINEEIAETLKEIISTIIQSEVLLTSKLLGRCPSTFIEALIGILKKLEAVERDSDLYIVIPKEISFLVKEKLPGDKVIVV